MSSNFPVKFKKCLAKLKHLFHLKETPLQLAPIEGTTNKHSTITKNVYAETTDQNSNNTQVVIVEVESFHDNSTHVADLSLPKKVKAYNYTREGDDPNLKITHYPPSNRLH